MLKFFYDTIETQLRRIEQSDHTTALMRPEHTTIPVVAKSFETSVYDSTASQERTPFDSVMDRIVIFAILVLFLEWSLDAFAYQFAIINIGVLVFFVAEFLVRYNYRRSRYLRTWGLRVDLPIILIEFLVLYLYFATLYQSQPVTTLASLGVHPGIGPIGSDGSQDSGWLETLELWKILRLCRFVRIVKLLRDISGRPGVWKLRFRTLGAWMRAISETLSIMIGTALVLIVLTNLLTDQNPEQIIRQFIANVLDRLRANQDTGVKNSDVLRAIYQVFTILSAMIVVAFFTQLLVPIVNRIKESQEQEVENIGREHHAVVAIADEGALGLLEEAIQIWAVYEKSEVVVLVPEEIELGDSVHPSYHPDVIKGSIYSRGSWLAADASGADQIVVLSESAVNPAKLSTFLPTLSQRLQKGGVVLLVSNATSAYSVQHDESGIRYATLSVEPLSNAIETAIGDRNSIQHQLTEQLNEKFDKANSILGKSQYAGDAVLTVRNIKKALKVPRRKSGIEVSEQANTVLVKFTEEADEVVEGNLIQKLRVFVRENPKTAPVLVFVGSLHLVGVNAQLGNDSQLRVVPIELLVMYAVYHESACPGLAKAWLLPPDALLNKNGIDTISSPFRRTTYRNRNELGDVFREHLGNDSDTSYVVGILRAEDGVFRGFLTQEMDDRKLVSRDRIVITKDTLTMRATAT